MKKQLLFTMFLVAFAACVNAQRNTTMPPVNSLGPAKPAHKQPTSNAPTPKLTSTLVSRSPVPKSGAGKTTGRPDRSNTTQPSRNKPKPGLTKTTKSAGTTVAPHPVRRNQ